MNAINVIPSSSGNGFTMNLRNGSINVDDKTGMYVISTGCGAGKSTSIKELIKLKADKGIMRSEEHTSELQSRPHLVCRLLLEKKKKKNKKEKKKKTIKTTTKNDQSSV